SVIVAFVAVVDAVEHGGGDGEIAVPRPTVDDAANPVAEPPDFLDDHDPATRSAIGPCAVRIELKAVARGEFEALAHDDVSRWLVWCKGQCLMIGAAPASARPFTGGRLALPPPCPFHQLGAEERKIL